MNREIKFRVWDGKIMYMSPTEIRQLGSWFEAHYEGSLAKAKLNSLMQFTGLSDKNGVEIFEGDIIEFDKQEWYRSPVRTRHEIDKMPAHREVITFGPEGVSRGKSDLETYCEVIGNIHENPK